MPELPEVEVVVRSLGDFLPGQKILSQTVLRDKSFPQGERESTVFLEIPILKVQRRAKFIDILFENGWHLLTHLKMTGQLIYVGPTDSKSDHGSQVEIAGGGHPTNDWINQLPGNHTRIIYELSGGGKLFYNDQRVFGWMKLLTQAELERDFYAALGPDANTADFTAELLLYKLKNKRVPIKQAIMDNKVVCGLGNIYAAEVLFAAEISPLRPANQVTLPELEKIVEFSKLILAEAIAEGGTTFDGKYVDGEGKSGNFATKLKVYGRADQPCMTCGEKLNSVKLGARGTIYCENCQK